MNTISALMLVFSFKICCQQVKKVVKWVCWRKGSVKNWWRNWIASGWRTFFVVGFVISQNAPYLICAMMRGLFYLFKKGFRGELSQANCSPPKDSEHVCAFKKWEWEGGCSYSLGTWWCVCGEARRFRDCASYRDSSSLGGCIVRRKVHELGKAISYYEKRYGAIQQKRDKFVTTHHPSEINTVLWWRARQRKINSSD